MKIYVAHTKEFDYKNELYVPLLKSELSGDYELIFPHKEDGWKNSKEVIKGSDLVIAEVSYPSISLGIELGWANAFGVPVVCVYREGVVVSKSLRAISDKIISYNSSNLIAEISRETTEVENK